MTARRATSARAGTPRRMTSESRGWRRTAHHSPSVSEPRLSRMRLETPSLPMSCSSAARRSQRSRTGVEPELLADPRGVGRHAGRCGARCTATSRRRRSRTPRRLGRAPPSSATRDAVCAGSTLVRRPRRCQARPRARRSRSRRAATRADASVRVEPRARAARAPPSHGGRRARPPARRPPSTAPDARRPGPAARSASPARSPSGWPRPVPVLERARPIAPGRLRSSRPITRAMPAPRSQRIRGQRT